MENRYIEDRISALELNIQSLEARCAELEKSQQDAETKVSSIKKIVGYERIKRFDIQDEIGVVAQFLFTLGRFLERDTETAYPGSMTEVFNSALERMTEQERDAAERVIAILEKWRS